MSCIFDRQKWTMMYVIWLHPCSSLSIPIPFRHQLYPVATACIVGGSIVNQLGCFCLTHTNVPHNVNWTLIVGTLNSILSYQLQVQKRPLLYVHCFTTDSAEEVYCGTACTWTITLPELIETQLVRKCRSSVATCATVNIAQRICVKTVAWRNEPKLYYLMK